MELHEVLLGASFLLIETTCLNLRTDDVFIIVTTRYPAMFNVLRDTL